MSQIEEIRRLVSEGEYRLTQHAQIEMADEEISLDDVFDTLLSGEIIEEYPVYRRGPCCLVAGETAGGLPLHVVCTMSQPRLIVITVYRPRPPKWISPKERGPRT